MSETYDFKKCLEYLFQKWTRTEGKHMEKGKLTTLDFVIREVTRLMADATVGGNEMSYALVESVKEAHLDRLSEEVRIILFNRFLLMLHNIEKRVGVRIDDRRVYDLRKALEIDNVNIDVIDSYDEDSLENNGEIVKREIMEEEK